MALLERMLASLVFMALVVIVVAISGYVLALGAAYAFDTSVSRAFVGVAVAAIMLRVAR